MQLSDYEPQIEQYLAGSVKDRIYQWIRDGYSTSGDRLFEVCGKSGGCPTMIKSGNYSAYTPELTAMIRAARIPASRNGSRSQAPVAMNREQLETIARIQLEVRKYCYPGEE